MSKHLSSAVLILIGLVAGVGTAIFVLRSDWKPADIQIGPSCVSGAQGNRETPRQSAQLVGVGLAASHGLAVSGADPSPRLASIAGSAWLLRNSGSSDLLRGLPVCLLPAKVPAKAVHKQFEGKLESWGQYIGPMEQLCNAMEARWREVPRYPKYRDEYWESVARKLFAEDAVKSLAKFLNGLSGEPSMVDIHKNFGEALMGLILAKVITGERMQFLDAISPLAVQRTTTGADGKYSFDSVPSGKYVLYALMDTKSLCAEWVLAIGISAGGEVSVDLSNQNATTLLNKNSDP